MKNFKKILVILGLVAVVGVSIIGAGQIFFPTEQGAKQITITVIDEMNNKVVVDKKVVRTDALELGELLDEQKEKLDVVMQDGSFGRYIESISGLVGDMNSKTGPWILYSSTNNEACKAAGWCPGVDDLPIKDQDEFTFKLTDKFE
jgi:hypothetical protein